MCAGAQPKKKLFKFSQAADLLANARCKFLCIARYKSVFFFHTVVRAVAFRDVLWLEAASISSGAQLHTLHMGHRDTKKNKCGNHSLQFEMTKFILAFRIVHFNSLFFLSRAPQKYVKWQKCGCSKFFR